jgi:4-hydroxy-tetrahydrodipicolinate synthase
VPVRFPGVIPAVTTPFDARGEVDAEGLAANVDWLVESGMEGLVATGTMGEAGSLRPAERRLVVESVVRAAAGRVPVVAGISSGTPAAAIDLATDAAAAGVEGLMLLPPLGYRGDAREVEAYYRDVAGATGLPVMLYNNPEASGVDLAPELIVTIAERVEAVVAVKECSGDARRIPAIINASGGELEVLVGGDDWPLEGFCGGATGWVSGVAVVAPRECRALYEHCRAGELEEARALYARLLPLARFDMTPKLVQYFKAAQDAVGRVGGPVRSPRLELTEDERAELAAALAVLGAPVAS